uniref:Uncharacterized protein n=1 Tax=Pseudomonas sp. GLE121 TaxID=1329969 RepID=R4L3Z2_9PSED|nr:hypothetical protein [Pseudomonas sp. GLE121]AGL12865.1 hypothetical protein [Pseudomonas sp. GLE121]
MSANTQPLNRQDFLAFWHGRASAAFVAADIISGLEETAQKGCGLYFELYQGMLLRSLRAESESLTPEHRVTFMQVLWARRIRIDDAAIAEAEQAESECWIEINASQE